MSAEAETDLAEQEGTPRAGVEERPAAERSGHAEHGGSRSAGDQGRPEEEELEERHSEAELDPETIARRDAALARIRKFGDPVLRAAALPVERFDAALAREAERMASLMQDALGVGLAATQVGVLHRVLVYQAYTDDPVTVLVNPEIRWRSDELEAGAEGCLSLPGVHVQVERPVAVRVRGLDEHGKPFEVEAEGLEARVIQHEIDHLDGILVLDRIPREERKEAMRAMREAMRASGGA